MKNVSAVPKAMYILTALLLCSNFSSFARFKRRAKKETPTETKISPKEREYNLKVGETFTIPFESGPPGEWCFWLVSQPEHELPIKLVNTAIKSSDPEIEGGAIGGGKIIEFTFQAQKATSSTHRETFINKWPSSEPQDLLTSFVKVNITE